MRRICLLILPSFFACFAQASGFIPERVLHEVACHVLFRDPQDFQNISDEPPRLVTTTYSHDFKSADYRWYREAEGKYEPYFSHYMDFHGSDYMANLIEGSQLFPLRVMQERSRLPEEQKELLLQVTRKLNSRQFKSYELLHTVEGDALAGKVFDIKHGDVPLHMVAAMRADRGIETEAFLWSVSGQLPSAESKIEFHKMAWQLDEEFQNTVVDRNIFKFVWELGRGAQTQSGGVNELLKASLLGMVNELLAFGGSLDDAYVFLHPLGKSQSHLWRMQKHPKTGQPLYNLYASVGQDGSNDVLVARLSDLLDIHSPALFSKRIAGFMGVGGNKIDWFGAAEHLFAMQNSTYEYLTFSHPMAPPNARPIMLTDSSEFPGWAVAKVAQKYGIFEKGPQITRYMNTLRDTDRLQRSDMIVDHEKMSRAEVSKLKTAALSNFDRNIARSNPDYVKIVLIAAFFYYHDKMMRSYPGDAGAIMARLKFTVNSGQTEVLQQANKIPGHVVEALRWSEYRGRFGPDTGYRFRPVEMYFGGPVYVYDFATMVNLINSHPQLAREARYALKKGHWQAVFHQTDAVGF